MAAVDLVVTKASVRSGCGYLSGGMESSETLTVDEAVYRVGLALSLATCSIERIIPTQLKLAVQMGGERLWYFFGPSKDAPEGFVEEFIPEAMRLIRSNARGLAMCSAQAEIVAFPGVRISGAAAA